MTDHINDYFKSVCEAYRLGNTESDYNAPIMTLLAQFGCTARDKSGERKGQAGENTDIKLWHGDVDPSETEPFAGVEVKKVGGIDNRATAQVKTAAMMFGNAILTDNLVWQFWRAGEDKMYAGVRLIEQTNAGFALIEDGVELFISLVEEFMLHPPAQIRSSNRLAEYMAKHAKIIRGVITGILKDDGNGQPLVDERQKTKIPMFLELYGLYSKIKSELRPYIDTRKFADMYAQTIVYGLFIARYNDAESKTFNRYEAIGKLKEESMLLNQFFTHIANTRGLHPTLESVIDKLCELYITCDIAALLDRDEKRDTIVHFYEDFLTYYDPEQRKKLGVFYTPYQVVRYMISMVDKLLIEEFCIDKGLANNEQMQIDVPCEPYLPSSKHKIMRDTKEITVPRVAVLDPACGTGTFHAEIINYIKDTYFSGGRSAFYDDYMRQADGLLSRLIGFEIMMTSYVVAHLNIRRAIEKTLGHTPEKQLPTRIYLTNTLAPPSSALEQDNQISLFDFSAAITDEAYKADTWKIRRPIKVIIGNPPYLAASTNPYDISAYKTETDGVTDFGERKHLLNDDYVKFFRFAEQIINSNNEGILAFVSNNGYLDNHTFRGMRGSLLRSFDKIFIVNLHGSSVKKEVAPDGGKDENIFDIMQGVSLFIGVKTTTKNDWAKVFYCDLWGTRELKFQSLEQPVFDFVELRLDPKMAYFVPFANDDEGATDKEAYERGVNVAELFPAYVTGLESGNDKVAIAPTKAELCRRIEIVKNATDVNPINEIWGKYSAGQSAQKIQEDALSSVGVVAPILYRPFDERWTYYTGNSCGWVFRPRNKNIIGQLIGYSNCPIGRNIGLVFTKQTTQRYEWDGIFISDQLVVKHYIDYPAKSTGYVAPLYLKPEGIENEWQPNINAELFVRLTENLEKKPEPLEVFDYIYGILHDPSYRTQFGDYLSRDFPRVPIIENDKVFAAYVKAGERLRKLHLMQEKVPAELELEPNTSDNLEIGKIKYKDGVLHLNDNKRIIGIPEDVWAYRIGGYQVLDKWFKSHRGEVLTMDRFDHVCNVVGLLGETIKVQEGVRGIARGETDE